MKFVLEISERERDALRKAGKEIKNVFKKIADSFEIKVVKNKK
ncbi:MAG: hypothetical protein AABW93_01540 [Nanoarchaeota archaeon]